jgi:reverse gyrase
MLEIKLISIKKVFESIGINSERLGKNIFSIKIDDKEFLNTDFKGSINNLKLIFIDDVKIVLDKNIFIGEGSDEDV